MFVLVQRRAVETAQAVGVGGENAPAPSRGSRRCRPGGRRRRTRRSPPACRSARWGEQPERLVAPGAAEGMFHHRHQLDMGEAELARVGNQLLRQFRPVRRPAVAVAPGAGVDFVDRQRCRIALAPARRASQSWSRHSWRNAAQSSKQSRAASRRPAPGVGLQRQEAVVALQLVLVQFASPRRGTNSSDAGWIASSHRVTAPVPAVEIADHRDAHGVRRPDCEAHALHAFVTGQLRAQAGGQLAVVAFGEQVEVEFAEQRPEGIGSSLSCTPSGQCTRRR